jgi:hypothetical protein
MKKLILILLSTLLWSCGGGGGSSGSSDLVGGVYTGNLGLTSNSCGASIPSALPVDWRVSQSGSDITLEAKPADTIFTGALTDDDQITVSRQDIDEGCTIDLEIRINSIQAESGFGRLTVTSSCPADRCRFTYEGSLQRS